MNNEVITLSPERHVTQEIAQDVTYQWDALQFYVFVGLVAFYLLVKLIRR